MYQSSQQGFALGGSWLLGGEMWEQAPRSFCFLGLEAIMHFFIAMLLLSVAVFPLEAIGETISESSIDSGKVIPCQQLEDALIRLNEAKKSANHCEIDSDCVSYWQGNATTTRKTDNCDSLIHKEEIARFHALDFLFRKEQSKCHSAAKCTGFFLWKKCERQFMAESCSLQNGLPITCKDGKCI